MLENNFFLHILQHLPYIFSGITKSAFQHRASMSPLYTKTLTTGPRFMISTLRTILQTTRLSTLQPLTAQLNKSLKITAINSKRRLSSKSENLKPKPKLTNISKNSSTMSNAQRSKSPPTPVSASLNSTETGTPDPLYNLFLAHIDQYFASQRFTMNTQQQQSLRGCMEKVYTKKLPLFCFDVEAWERNNNLVTEIGIAIFDPKGQEFSAFPHIKLYHIIIEEHAKKRNGRFVPDNMSNFVGGTTHVLPELEARKFLNKMIHKYFIDDPERKAAFVGHHIGGDIKWLKTIGVDFPDGCPIIDTYKIFQLSHGKTGGGLRQILRIMDIPHAYLHNAANDAYYTLLAALSWCDPNLRRLKKLDSHVIPEFVQQEPKPKSQQIEDKRNKRLEKFTDNAKWVRIGDHKFLE